MLSNRIMREIQLAAAIHWYQQGEISQEKAAEIAGLNRRDFLSILADREVDVFDLRLDALREELQFR
jgi:predicted HTH domain antitoxin